MKASIEGRITQKLSPQGGTSKAGKEWKKQTLIIEIEEEGYKKSLSIDFWNEIASAAAALNVGDVCQFECEAVSKEYNNNWYTNIGCWKFHKLESAPEPEQPKEATPEPQETNDGNLPF